MDDYTNLSPIEALVPVSDELAGTYVQFLRLIRRNVYKTFI
ncbi:hypothetical protein LEP1GSC074_0611 [Leptospira noguchii str. Hook]|nr:hypothetical protein LEP1GSC074_0611 [Leptospira noguchii str. Hook]